MNRMSFFQYLLLMIILLLSIVLILLSVNNVICVSIRNGRGGMNLEINMYVVVIYLFLFNIMNYIRRNNWMKYILLIMIISILIVSVVNYSFYPFTEGCYDSNSLTLHYFGSDPPWIVAGIEDYSINLLLVVTLSISFILLIRKKYDER